MNVRELRNLINSGIPDDTLIVVRGADHSYRKVVGTLDKAVTNGRHICEYHSDLDIEADADDKLINVLVLS